VIPVVAILPVVKLVGFIPISNMLAEASSEKRRLSGIFRTTSLNSKSLEEG
jgi:hypothetical protein